MNTSNIRKAKSMKVTITPFLNRSMIITAYPDGKPMHFAIYFHKKTSSLDIQYNGQTQSVVEGNINIDIQRNLKKSKFCKCFFKLEDVDSKSMDFKSRFVDVNPRHKHQIFQFLNEKTNLQNYKRSKELENYLWITGWKIVGYDDDLIYYLFQRKCFDSVTKQEVVRTCALQYSTPRGANVLSEYENYIDNDIVKVEDESEFPSFFKCVDIEDDDSYDISDEEE